MPRILMVICVLALLVLASTQASGQSVSAGGAAAGPRIRTGTYSAKTIQCGVRGYTGCVRFHFKIVRSRCLRGLVSRTKVAGYCITSSSQSASFGCDDGQTVKVALPILDYLIPRNGHFQIDRPAGAGPTAPGRFFLELRFNGAAANGTLALTARGGVCKLGPNVLSAKRL